MKFINVKNLSLMYVWQVSNYTLSFILTPYLARVLHPSGFGIYAYVLGVNTYLWIVVEWGFPAGGVREIASRRNDPAALQQVFWTIVQAKMGLALVAAAMLVLLSLLSKPEIRDVVLLSGLMTIVGATLASDWFAQGVEKLGLFIGASITARIGVTLLTFLLVRDAHDAQLAAMLHGIFGLFGGLVGFVVITVNFRYFPKRQRLADVRRAISSNFSLFLAKANGILYVSAPPLLLGLLTTTAQVGIYAGADKISRVCVMLIGPIGLVVSPRIFSSMTASKETAAVLSGRFLMVQVMLSLPMSAGLFLFAPQIISLVLGGGYEQSVELLRILSPLPLMIGLSSSLGNQFLVPLGLDWSFAALALICSLSYVAILSLLSLRYSAAGAGISLLMVETMMIGGALLILLRDNRRYMRDAWRGIAGFNPLELVRSR
ncbi:MAG: oligosaccharide flippase family protein [Sphingomonadales bacterium]|nr:oligosaccharide flippase family protein [Sphingomonadales bacterium]MDE2570494.1 oligosaccharide flippase family protein [Sphingomonadales bacterium]